VKTLHLDKNSGKGAAVKAGFEIASGNVLMVQDADSELLPADIPSLLQAMHQLNVQFVNGSRYLPGIVRPISSYKRYLANRLFTFFTSLLIDVKFTDMACGYKVIHRDLYQQLKIRENRFGFEAELIIKAMRVKRNNVAEVPVNYFPRNNGEGKKLKNSDGFKILWTVMKYGLFRVN
jgi:glycosyltransferase involved in cell wall biosynthesis